MSSHQLTYLLSDKCNSIMAITTGLISSLINVASFLDMPFANRSACIMVVPSLLLFSFGLYSFLHYNASDNLQYTHYGFSAQLGLVQSQQWFFLRYSPLRMFPKVLKVAGNETQSNSKIKQHIHFIRLIVKACVLTIKHSVFSIMTGLIVELFFFVCNAVKWAENEVYWLTDFPLLKSNSYVCQKRIMMIILLKLYTIDIKKQTNKIRKNYQFFLCLSNLQHVRWQLLSNYYTMHNCLIIKIMIMKQG